jgi:nitrite reductase/ring-hydroxylating ferredoxin subunit
VKSFYGPAMRSSSRQISVKLSTVPLVRVARTNEIPNGQVRFFSLGSRSVVVAHYAGQFYAVDGVCPHKGFELEHAQLWDHLIECPWHRYQYDIRTGENCFPTNIYTRDLGERIEPIACYRVELKGEEIWVDVA